MLDKSLYDHTREQQTGNPQVVNTEMEQVSLFPLVIVKLEQSLGAPLTTSWRLRILQG